MMNKILVHLKSRAKHAAQSTKKVFAQWAKHPPKNLDVQVQKFHDEAFEKIDCLSCANCCKTTSPIFTNKDVERISKHLKMRPASFVETYLNIDADEDYVLKSSPCTFLDPDNYCGIYDVRPKACREYPHTNRKQFHKILPLTLKNTSICPAVFEIVEKLKKAN